MFHDFWGREVLKALFYWERELFPYFTDKLWTFLSSFIDPTV